MQANASQYTDFLKHLGIQALTEMQTEVIANVNSGKNLLTLAPTGSGKTLTFLLPLVSKLSHASKEVQAIIIAPSRELSLQIEQVLRGLKTSFKISCVYGGHSVKIEENSLAEAPAVIIGTPGRLADHIRRKSFDVSYVRTIVLDEFDKSLQMGFHRELETIFKSLHGRQQFILTSATRLDPLPEILPLKEINTLNFLTENDAPKLNLKLVRTRSIDKVESLLKLVSTFNQEVCIVFCNHREAVDRISTLFHNNDFAHGILHGAMEQIDREKNLIKFRGGAHNVLISTDLASRGLDIPEIRHIVHYQLPPNEEAFIHRNGRTARMHANGDGYLIVADDETIPEYIDKAIEEVKLPAKLKLPDQPEYACVYISAGKKDKISKGDIVGLLTKKGGLAAGDIGLITTLDHSSYASVKRSKLQKTLAAIKNEKLKGSKVKIEVAS